MKLQLLTQVSKTAVWLALVILVGCAAPSQPDQSAFRNSRPTSILVLPPVNQSTDIRGSLSFLATVTQPLSEAGYYVFPVAMVEATFKENGLPLPDQIHEAPLSKLQSILVLMRCSTSLWRDTVAAMWC